LNKVDSSEVEPSSEGEKKLVHLNNIFANLAEVIFLMLRKWFNSGWKKAPSKYSFLR
jgi:hypothetical protein